ncbi:Putative F0F1-ATPase subunit Ca2+/Mg2+ transporter [Selenomonas ruminantium]|uniref:Putative F0F1-ATPase subunit Ca2+/Mg2+ transporter n=1 Tax=Selenomonas ruminantium TaxID=971 RepID=A0A1M6TTH1_SELRU|nr:AtpZ/AtpI family protein [Selenomonas ruminantium]SHK60302.1 Putative F0F1-ATPase subunit Ca2+/Mg2+ transporter [Selenomonas ruminantium]
MSRQEESALKQALRAFSILGGVGIYLVVFVAICGFLGAWIGDHLEIGNAGRIIGIIAGFPAAFYTLYRQLKNNGLL